MKLCFPEKILEQHVAVLGKTGAGKSSALRHIVEHLLQHDKRVCVIDPKGDWWGLKSSADGRSAGFPVIAFGDFKNSKATDIPVNEHSGKHVAELIASGNRPCIIGFRGWMTGKMIRFWIDFASTLFNANSGELYLVGDEFHNFAPKGKILDPEAGKCLHWSNRLMSEGRGYGLVCLIASQRPQKVHNDTLTCCETLVAMKVIHASDRGASKEWIEGCGDMEQGKEVLNSLAGLDRGEAFVWSPEIKFGPVRLKFPLFETFDSFAPPQLQKKVMESGWSAVDLAAVKDKLAAVIEEAKANDPRELKAEIARLKKELHQRDTKTQNKLVETKITEVPVFTKIERKKLVALVSALEANTRLCDKALTLLQSIPAQSPTAADIQLFKSALEGKFSAMGGPPSRVVARLPIARPEMGRQQRIGARLPVAGVTSSTTLPSRASVDSNGHLPTGERKILSALIQFPDGLRREQLTVLTTFKRSTRDAYIQRLREKDLVMAEGELVHATERGIATLPEAEPLPTGEALQQYWLAKLPEGERRILEILLAAYPEAMDREMISEQTDFKRSTRDAYLQRMSAKMLFTEPTRGQVRAADQLFS